MDSNQMQVVGHEPLPQEPVKPTPPDYDDVGAFGLSFRGYLTFIFVITCCGLWCLGKTVPDALLALTSLTVGFYFKR